MSLDIAPCPRCGQKVNSQAITCPYCRAELKAFGHPGIALHRAKGDEYLCNSCVYHSDDSCNYPKRPYATECTLYVNIEESKLQAEREKEAKSFSANWNRWLKRNQSLLLILGLLFVCLLIVVTTR